MNITSLDIRDQLDEVGYCSTRTTSFFPSQDTNSSWNHNQIKEKSISLMALIELFTIGIGIPHTIDITAEPTMIISTCLQSWHMSLSQLFNTGFSH